MQFLKNCIRPGLIFRGLRYILIIINQVWNWYFWIAITNQKFTTQFLGQCFIDVLIRGTIFWNFPELRQFYMQWKYDTHGKTGICYSRRQNVSKDNIFKPYILLVRLFARLTNTWIEFNHTTVTKIMGKKKSNI